MTRFILTFAVAASLALWADAQQTGGLLAADRVRLLEANRALVEKLVARTVEISDQNDALKRAKTCQKSLAELTAALKAAIDGQDAARIAELGDHLADLTRDGLAPCIGQGRDYAAGSQPAIEMKSLRDATIRDLALLEQSVPRTGPLGQSNQVKETLVKWQAAAKAVTDAK